MTYCHMIRRKAQFQFTSHPHVSAEAHSLHWTLWPPDLSLVFPVWQIWKFSTWINKFWWERGTHPRFIQNPLTINLKRPVVLLSWLKSGGKVSLGADLHEAIKMILLLAKFRVNLSGEWTLNLCSTKETQLTCLCLDFSTGGLPLMLRRQW